MTSCAEAQNARCAPNRTKLVIEAASNALLDLTVSDNIHKPKASGPIASIKSRNKTKRSPKVERFLFIRGGLSINMALSNQMIMEVVLPSQRLK
jgi:hypothetical protein